MATSLRVYLCIKILVTVVLSNTALAKENIPQFRHIDAGTVARTETISGEVKLLTDDDFAPFSFKTGAGSMTGLSVELAQAACAELRLKCVIIARPFNELLPALNRGEGDAIISGLRMTKEIMQQATMTRPYFFSRGQFIARVGAPFAVPDTRTLAGRRLGFVKGTSHQAFLEKYFDRAALTPFENEAILFESLRTGSLDIAFADSLHAQFWLRGPKSRGCCTTVGTGFVDRGTFSRGLAFLMRRDRDPLRENFDYALDRLQVNGTSAKLFARYFPDFVF